MSLKVLFALLAVALCVQIASGRFWHHKDEGPQCNYKSDKGQYDLSLLVRDMKGRDWVLQDEATHSTYFFNPCGGVHSDKCPEDTAFCQVTDKDQGISFGSSSDPRWAVVEDGVEITYANGEPCNSGVPRKSVVQLICSHPTTTDAASQRTLVTDMIIDDCLVTIKVTSPYGCPVEQFCGSFTEEQCESSDGVCEYDKEGCKMSSSNCFRWNRHRISAPALFGILLSIAVLISCGVGLCLCACCRSRRTRNMRLPVVAPKKKKRCSRKRRSSKKAPAADAPAPAQEFVYQPLQQYVPMTQFYAPLNPYGVPEAFPMVQIVGPVEEQS